ARRARRPGRRRPRGRARRSTSSASGSRRSQPRPDPVAEPRERHAEDQADDDVRRAQPQPPVLAEAMGLEHPGAERRVAPDQPETEEPLRAAARARAVQHPEEERAGQVDGQRAVRERAPEPRPDRAVEQEARDGADAAEEPDAHHHRERHEATRTRFVAAATASRPKVTLAAAYPTATPTEPWSSMSSSSTCTVENVVSAPHTPVPRNGRREADSGRP